MGDGHTECVEEHENYDKPVESLRLHSVTNPEPARKSIDNNWEIYYLYFF